MSPVLFIEKENAIFNRGHYIIHRMDAATAQELIALNRRFYQEFGPAFSATRQRLQPGVRQILTTLKGTEQILDLGCGNGELARELARNGFGGTYQGLDFSLPLLDEARRQPSGFSINFRAVDLSTTGWADSLEPGAFDQVFAFAVFHHMPGHDLRLAILRSARRLLAPGGQLALSSWQFLNSARLKARVQPWERAGLKATQVDAGDYLLDWRSGGQGLRYVHHFSAEEWGRLAAESGFRVVRSFQSDGENRLLGLYQVWSKTGDETICNASFITRQEC